MAEYTLGYWRIRGKGQLPRLLLSYTGLKFQQKLYTSPVQWFGADKDQLDLPFPNLPYLISGDIKLTESSAIARYIITVGNKPQLLGKTIQDQAIVNNVLGVLDDIFNPAIQLCFNDKFNEEKDKVFTENLKPKIDRIYTFLDKKDWILGYMTLADFKIAEAVNYLEGIWPDHVKEYPYLLQLRERFNNIPEIKAYYERPDAVRGPYLPPTAKWH